jgi:uncharacterized protein (DUF1697 family)
MRVCGGPVRDCRGRRADVPRAKANQDRVFAALLRGVNVGGRNLLPMRALAPLFAANGCAEVRTYIQSGNVVFRASDACAAGLVETIPNAIEDAHGFRPAVVLRSSEEVRAILRRNPFVKAGADPATLHVAFLPQQPARSAVAALDPGRSPPDEFVVKDREIFLRYPGGMGRSKLTNAYFDSKLSMTCTIRNWRTVQAIAEMMQG